MLEIQNVSKTFNAGTVNEKTALNGLNLKLNEGDFVTVIGGNGAGKSTMLNAVAGVWPVDCGKIIIDGVDVTRLGEHQRAAYIGRVFQDPMTGTAATMQIEENLALAARRGKRRTLRIGITKAEREQYCELLKTLDLGLEDRLTARVGLLSGGQRQALTLLMATMNKPKLLLLDEHTAALDPKTALKVLTLSARIVEENHLTTMMITHNMKDAIKYGNRLIMMHEGHIIYDVAGEEKQKLHVSDLLAKFQIASGGEFGPEHINDRSTFGHWEMDSVESCQGVSNTYIVMTERKTRWELIIPSPDKTAASVVAAIDGLEAKYGDLFPKVFRSITCDNGCEFADAAGIERSASGKGTRTEVYYCHPYRPSERGSNENQNGLIRRHLPKGTDLSTVSYEETKRIEDWLNNYPRKMFGYLCSEQLFREEIALILAS